MYCTNCGKPIKEDDRFCTVCGTELKSKMEDLVYSVDDNKGKVQNSANDFRNEQLVNVENEKNLNKMPKRTYEFASSVYMCFRFLCWGKIFSSITIEEEKMNISIEPKKKNIYPSIYLSDIINVNVSFVESNYCLFGAVIIATAGIFSAGIYSNPLSYFAMALVLFWLGENRKISIQMKHGREVNIYSFSKRRANQFRDDLLKILKG